MSGLGVRVTSRALIDNNCNRDNDNQQNEFSHQNLLAFDGGIALIDPVGAEVVGDIENFQVGEAHRVELVVGGGDVGAAIPWAAAAVENDGGVFGKRGDAVFEDLKAAFLIGGARVLGAGNVGFGEEDVRSDLEDEWLG